MNRIFKITYYILIVVCCLAFGLYKYRHFEDFWFSVSTLLLLALFLSIPAILFWVSKSLNKENYKSRWPIWIANFLIGIGIVPILFLSGKSIMRDFKIISRDRIQHKIQSAAYDWIMKNALYPDSYAPDFFGYYKELEPQKAKSPANFTILSDNEKRENHIENIEADYYEVNESCTIKNKNLKEENLWIAFVLSKDYVVLDVMINKEHIDVFSKYKDSIYEWRRRFGKPYKNLELEKNHLGEKFIYKDFDRFGNLIRIVPFVNGRINGIVVNFRENGDTSGIMYFKDGVRNGLTEEICRNGNLLYKGVCVNGEFNGLCTWWHCNGQKETEGRKTNGKKDGLWKDWDEKGVLAKEETWEIGKLVNTIDHEGADTYFKNDSFCKEHDVR